MFEGRRLMRMRSVAEVKVNMLEEVQERFDWEQGTYKLKVMAFLCFKPDVSI